MIIDFNTYKLNESKSKPFVMEDVFDEDLLQMFNDYVDSIARKLDEKYTNKWIRCGFYDKDENIRWRGTVKITNTSVVPEEEGVFINNDLLDISVPIISIDELINGLKERFLGKEVIVGRPGDNVKPQFIVKDVTFNEKAKMVCLVKGNDDVYALISDHVQIRELKRIISEDDPYGEEIWEKD